MKPWYKNYWAQTWYRNTFLIHAPEEIAQAIRGDREWNNLYDSGCNFTCLAMIVGVDPARLASAIAERTDAFFEPDNSLPARFLTGEKGGLIWDQNRPHKGIKNVSLKDFWHPNPDRDGEDGPSEQSKGGRRVTITLRFVECTPTKNYLAAKKYIVAARKKGLHVVCGAKDHSHLVAGSNDDDFYLWDPDDSEDGTSVERNMNGEFTLRQLFEDHKRETIEFWIYSLELV